MPRLAAAVLLVLVSALSLISPAQAVDRRDVDPVTDGVHVIGDSISYHAHRQVLASPPPNWTRDAVPGRRMVALRNALVDHSTERTVAIHHMFSVTRKTRVSTVVVALGTNGVLHRLTVEQAARFYRTAIRTLRAQDIWKPGPRKIVLVPPYTDSRIEGVPALRRQWPSKTSVYAAAIKLVARQSTDVCVTRWPEAISRRTDLLYDGVHPDRTGLQIWKNQLLGTIRTCGAAARL